MCWLTGASQVALLVLENEVPLVARDEDHLDSRGNIEIEDLWACAL